MAAGVAVRDQHRRSCHRRPVGHRPRGDLASAIAMPFCRRKFVMTKTSVLDGPEIRRHRHHPPLLLANSATRAVTMSRLWSYDGRRWLPSSQGSDAQRRLPSDCDRPLQRVRRADCRHWRPTKIRVRFPPGGVVDVIEIDAVDRLPLRKAELVAPDGRATPASYLNVTSSPSVTFNQESPAVPTPTVPSASATSHQAWWHLV